MSEARDKYALALKHLERVQVAWDPPDWADLSLYGFYALEAAVVAVALHYGMTVQKTHWARVDAAAALNRGQGLPDVSALLRDLNETRKSVAYGDVQAPELEAEIVATEIEAFIDAVGRMLGR